MKIKTIEIAGFASALEALRLPYGLDCRSDKDFDCDIDHYYGEMPIVTLQSKAYIDPKDLALMSTLVKRGDEHAKVVRGIVVYAKVTAPIWLLRELETYRFGRERLASESTMHIECRGLSGEELERAKDEIPMGKIQETIDMYSYQTLRRIYIQRHNHRLPAWHQFCDWIKTLPLAKELILVGLEEA